MVWTLLMHVNSTIITFIIFGRPSNLKKDLEILILRQQLFILQRKLNSSIKPNPIEKMILAVLTTKIKRISHQSTNQLQDIIRIFEPETVLRWYRELNRRKWIYPNKNKDGLPAIRQSR